MIDLKEFLEKKRIILCNCDDGDCLHQKDEFPEDKCKNPKDITNVVKEKDLGLFFWLRGGKQFVKEHWTIFEYAESGIYGVNHFDFKGKDRIQKALIFCKIEHPERRYLAQDFLDCLACLGEDKVKELIRNLKEEGR